MAKGCGKEHSNNYANKNDADEQLNQGETSWHFSVRLNFIILNLLELDG